ncbi:putative autophagy-related protein 12 [Paratrimastix pyriformis]|uniref:Ubiquitin-like protein ATG12 n=1 Tax=Paratrimastix pyriformis TaxID=342808 RepID=A0ABQ8UHP1_9EUKA|nr:putative autophagy-related protein 12 [Paratrimastix pyriformis]
MASRIVHFGSIWSMAQNNTNVICFTVVRKASQLMENPPATPKKRTDDEDGEQGEGKVEKRREKFLREMKCQVLLKSVAGAPILQKKKFMAPCNTTFYAIINYLRRELALKPGDPLLVYIGMAFVPSPSDCIADLFECFNQSQQLVINYAITPAWG